MNIAEKMIAFQVKPVNTVSFVAGTPAKAVNFIGKLPMRWSAKERP
jgi:hypothetical protein